MSLLEKDVRDRKDNFTVAVTIIVTASSDISLTRNLLIC